MSFSEDFPNAYQESVSSWYKFFFPICPKRLLRFKFRRVNSAYPDGFILRNAPWAMFRVTALRRKKPVFVSLLLSRLVQIAIFFPNMTYRIRLRCDLFCECNYLIENFDTMHMDDKFIFIMRSEEIQKCLCKILQKCFMRRKLFTFD